MRTYQKTFNCSEQFPAEVNEEWNVTQGPKNKLAEHWRVVGRSKRSFTVEITVFFPTQ